MGQLPLITTALGVLLVLAEGQAIATAHSQQVPPADVVRSVVSSRCISCHHGAGPGPFALLSNADLKVRGPTMVKAIENGVMPPWIASASSIPMRDACTLSPSEVAAFVAWREAGFSAPTTAELGAPPSALPGVPVLEVQVAEEWQPNPEDPDALRSFAIPIGNDAAMRIRGWTAQRMSPTLAVRYNLALTDDRAALAADEADPGAGYRRLGDTQGATSGSAGCIGIDGEFMLPRGFALEVPKDAILVAEVKSTGRGKVESTGATLTAFAAEPTDRLLREFAVVPDRSAPAVRDGARVSVTTEPLNDPLDLVAVVLRPDMRALRVDLRVTHDGADDRILIEIPRYLAMLDRGYVLATPLALVRGDRIRLSIDYDTPASATRATPAAVLLTADPIATPATGTSSGEIGDPPCRYADFSAARAIGIEMVEVPGGGARIARSEVTQLQFGQVLGRNPSHHRQGSDAGQLPVESVTWYDAAEFCNELSRREHLVPRYQLDSIVRDPQGNIQGATVTLTNSLGYCLPTEAQWLSCTCGPGGHDDSPGRDSGVSADNSWFAPWSQDSTHPVMSKSPSASGCFDLRGNVWEWCEDAWVDKAASGPTWRCVRGGSYCDSPVAGACDFRSGIPAGTRNAPFGFRIAAPSPIANTQR